MNADSSNPSPGDTPSSATAGPSGTSNPTEPGAEFFDRIRGLGVVRPDRDRWAAGVCAGLARRWGLDPLLVRGVFVVVSLVGGFGLALYGVLWLLLPHSDGRIHAQQVLRGVVTAGFIGGALAVLCNLPFGAFHGWGGGWPFYPFGGGFAVLALVCVGIWWFVSGPGSRPGGYRRHGGYGGPGGYGGGPTGPGGYGGGPTGPGGYGSPSGHGAPGGSEAAGGYGTGYGTSGDHGVQSYGNPAGGTPAAGSTFGFVADPAHGQGGYPTATSALGPQTGSAGHGSASYGPAVQQPPYDGTTSVLDRPRTRRADVHAPSHAVTRATLGLALIAAAAILAWDRWAHPFSAPAWLVATAVALAVVALGVIFSGALGRRSGGLAPIAILLTVLATTGAAWHDTLSGLHVRQTWAPVTSGQTVNGYRLSTGEAVLDLTGPALAAGATSAAPVDINASLGIGRLVVIVPAGVGVQVDAAVGLGDVIDHVDGTGERGGPGVSRSITSGGPAMLRVQAKVGVGQLEVVPQGTAVQ
jgi:phage shock protein PspC (stress-responsive transcriptional regulator)